MDTQKQATGAAPLPPQLRGAHEVIGWQELPDRPLRIKVGFDPTAADLHLGHSVILTAMRRLQDAGHQLIFLLGDFTALIGDPTGRDSTRPPLTEAQIEANAATYLEQVGKVLDLDALEVRRNSEWLAGLDSAAWVRLAARMTVAQMLERDDFSARYKKGVPISLHEFLYPLAQGQDSVELRCDVEMGGTDQKFNLLVGREMQRQAGQPPQAVVTWPLLEGLDGVRKMSKSLDNAIGLDDPPEQMFGKLMSASDELMWRYYQLLSLESEERLAQRRARVDGGGNPMQEKLDLAGEVVARYWGQQAGEDARQGFVQRFSQRQRPDDFAWKEHQVAQDSVPLPPLLRELGLVQSSSEAHRLIKGGGVRVDGQRVQDAKAQLAAGGDHVLEVGKRRILGVRLRRKG